MFSSRQRNKFLTLAITAILSAAFVPVTATSSSAQSEAACRNLEQGGYFDRVPGPGGGGLDFSLIWAKASVVCLINQERAKVGLAPLQAQQPLGLAASAHAEAARDLKWWGPGKDPHVNPVTHSTITSRIQAENYCPNPTYWKFGEVAYNGWEGGGTPRQAVYWWVYVSTSGHRERVLDPEYVDVGVGAIGGSADPAGAGKADAGTYVVDFGVCRH